MPTAVRVAHPETDSPDRNEKHPNKKALPQQPLQPKKAANKKLVDWPLFWAYSKYWFWNIATKSALGIVYLALISQGLRYVLPDIGLRIYRLPGLAFLEYFEATYRIDLAHVFAVVPLISAWMLWHWNLEMYLRPEAFARHFRGWDIERMKRVILTMGIIIILGDAALFYASFALSGWGRATFSLPALIATSVYVTVLGFVTFVSLYLAESIDTIRKKED